MGRNIFKGGVGKGKPSDRTSRYKLPEGAVNRELVKTLFKHYLGLDSQGEISYHEPRYLAEVAELENIVPDIVSGQTTLDGVLFMLSHKVSPELRWHSGGFLTALVQVLYNRGENDFIIDTSLWEGHPSFIACYLEGEEGRLLKLTYRGFIGQFARDVSYCDLSFIGGGTTCGENANNSLFRLKMPKGQSMFHLGYNSSNNVFTTEGEVNYLGEGEDNTFYLSKYQFGIAPTALEEFKTSGNVLHIDKDGEYERIFP